MADSKTTALTISSRAPRVRVPRAACGVRASFPASCTAASGDPVTFAVDARELRHALHASGAVVELSLDGQTTPAVLKDAQRHPVRGETTHVDFVRVNLNVAIQAVVPVEVVGGEDSQGAKDGGIVDQPVREVNVEALPTAIPESIQIDASALSIGDTLTLEAAVIPDGVTLLDDPETVCVTVLAPRLKTEDEEGIEEETLLIGESASAAEDGDEAAAGE